MNDLQLEYRIGTFVTDRNLVVILWDDRLAGITGISPADALRKPLQAVIPDFEERNLHVHFRDVLKDGVVRVLSPAFHHYLIRCRPVEPSANFQWMQQRVTIAPVRTGETIVNAVVTIEDVTRRLDYEKELLAQLSSDDETKRLRAVEEIGRERGEGTRELLSVIGDGNWRVRHVAVDALATAADAEIVSRLIRTLKEEHADLAVLNSALSVLALADMDTLVPLTWLLNDPDEDLRIYAAQVLGDKGDRRAVPALVNALNDVNPNVCYQAIESLGKLRAAEVVEPLLRILERRDFYLSFPVIDALVKIGDKSVAPLLIPFLFDPGLSSPVVEAMGSLGDEEIAEPLVALLKTPDAPTQAVALALASLHDRYERTYGEGSHIADIVCHAMTAAGVENLMEALQGANASELRALALVLGWLEGKAVERVLTQLLGNPAVRREVVEALVRYGSRVTDLLVEQLGSQDIETCRAAIVALGRIGDARVVAPLVAALGRDDELTVVIVGALAKIGDRKSFGALLDLMGHENIAIRQAAVGALNSLGHPEMAKEMEQRLTDPDPLVRESAARIAGYFGYAQCTDGMIALAADENEAVRAVALEHLPFMDDARAGAVLRKAAADDTPKVRAAAVRAFSHMEPAQAMPSLTAALEDADPWVRYFACRSLGRIGLSERLDALAHVALSDGARYVRFAAVDAMGHIGGRRAVSFLSGLAASSDEEMARSAIGALGKIGHPDALPPLFEALKSGAAGLQIDAAAALGEHGGEGVARTLQWVAATETDEALVRGCIAAMRRLGTAEAVESLIELAVDQERRSLCIEALVDLGERFVEWVSAGLSYPHAAVRVAVIEVLARMRRPAASEQILSALDDPEPQVRMAAVEALGHLGNRNGDRKLAAMARSDSDASVRRAAKTALKR